jgi:hypothetical protein
LIALIANARGQKTEDGKTEDRRRTNPFSVLRRPFSDVRPALDFSKRPVLLQTHPGALAVKLGSRLDSNG